MDNSHRKAKPTPADIEAAERLRSIWDQKARSLGLTQEKMADILGGTQGLVSQYLTKRIPLNYKALMLFAKALDVDPIVIRNDLPEQSLTRIPSHSSDENFISVIGYNYSAGLGTKCHEIPTDLEGENVKLPRFIINRNNIKSNSLRLIYGSGDSMEPTIGNGDTIMFDISDTTPRDRKLFVLLTPGAQANEYNVKRCIFGKNGRIKFSSDNPKGDHYWTKPRWMDDPEYMIKIIGKVKWVGRWVD